MKGKLLRVVLPLAFWLAVWEAAAHLLGKELFLPTVEAVVRSLGELAVTGAFWRSAAATLLRVLAGFLLGALLGTGLGALTAACRWGDVLLSPALRAIRTVPVVSFILLLYFCLPTAQVPVVVSALMALPVAWRSARQGIAAADPLLVELAGAYRLGRWKTLRLVYLPAALPALAAGWETSLGLAWKSGVAAEVLCQPKWAAGTALQAAKAYLDTPGLVAWTVVIILMSVTVEGLLRWALRRWRGGRGA
ncbi:ABC transporter permease subunit [Pseudoflavonifractor phocaeensis]|uniref:ABC transporter permease n=1 Tax=Pseudoflavonifractor phocaeensis TaxID=1870988 RepID=UPI00313C05A7